MHKYIKNILLGIGLILPDKTLAAVEPATLSYDLVTIAVLIVVFGGLGWVLMKLVMGLMHFSFLHKQTLASLEKKPPKIPKPQVILGILLFTGAAAFFSVKLMQWIIGLGKINTASLAVVFGFIAVLAVIAQLKWQKLREYAFAVTAGTVIAWTLLNFHTTLFNGTIKQDPFLLAFTFVCIVVAWRALFGPWQPGVRAAVLGSFIGWILLSLLWKQPESQRLAYVLTIAIALVPAGLWLALFLRYHLQRKALVMLMFFGGMLSTAPILFYDAMVKRGIELHFFLFKITPENFSRTSSLFVSSSLSRSGVSETIVSLLVSFMFVGLIEEGSKYWIVRHTGERFFSSIADVVQLSIVVAIGFACAENILNPSYFQGFVKIYLLSSQPQWGAFFANVLGRSVLTSMVHIVATGIMGYLLGISIFARQYLIQAREAGRKYNWLYLLNYLLRVPQKVIFERVALISSLVIAAAVHGLFNFLVTLPNSLPGSPRTIGQMFGLETANILYNVPFLLIPSLLYVVGGFWLVSYLLSNEESQRERGIKVVTETFVSQRAGFPV